MEFLEFISGRMKWNHASTVETGRERLSIEPTLSLLKNDA
jgi:hypothetical protein